MTKMEIVPMTLPNDFGVLLQARNGATRLPGKMTMSFHQGRSILEIVILRALEAFDGTHVVLATTTSSEDEVLVRLAESYGIRVFRGSEHDVLQRFIDCANRESFSHLIRICADNPFIRPEYLQALTQEYLSAPSDYISYAFPDGRPIIRSHIGLFAELVATDALQRVAAATNDVFYHEHVTNFIYGNPHVFSTRWMQLPAEIRERNDIRLTVDTPEDFQMASELFALLEANGSSLSYLTKIIDERPNILQQMKKLISTYEK